MTASVSIEGVLAISREHRCRARSQSSAGAGVTFPQPVITVRQHYTAPGDLGREESRSLPAVTLTGWIDTSSMDWGSMPHLPYQLQALPVGGTPQTRL